MVFNEANAVEDLVLDALDPDRRKTRAGVTGEKTARYLTSAGWVYEPARSLDRKEGDVMVESEVREALIRLNSEIAARAEYADQVLYRLRAILLSGSGGNLVSSNEEFTAWLTGERTMPFGP